MSALGNDTTNVRDGVVELSARAEDVLPPTTSGELLDRYARGERVFHDAKLWGANLGGADLRGVDLANANLTGANLNAADLTDANLAGAHLANADLSRANLSGAKLPKAELSGAQLAEASLASAVLVAANLGNANLQRANLRVANLEGANLTGASLLDVETNARTLFRSAVLTGAKLRAHTIVDIEGLTERQRMRLDIHDSLAQLRREYSGFWLWIHLIALALFISPYAAFIIRATLATAVSPHLPATARPLASELGWYIVSAGGGQHVSPWCLLFLFGIIYNALRAALLYKTHALHLQHEVTGLPLTYVLEHDPPWFRAYWAAKNLFIINVVVALWHLGLALAEPVVLTPAF